MESLRHKQGHRNRKIAVRDVFYFFVQGCTSRGVRVRVLEYNRNKRPSRVGAGRRVTHTKVD